MFRVPMSRVPLSSAPKPPFVLLAAAVAVIVLIQIPTLAPAQAWAQATKAALAPLPESGVWYDDTGKGAVEIQPCGNALCGRIVWLKEPKNAAGQMLTDKLNPEPAKRGRPICGLQVLGNLQKQGDGTWDAGWVYDPKEGKSYDAALQVAGPGKLAVTGYLGVKFLSRTLSWTRAPADLPRCAS